MSKRTRGGDFERGDERLYAARYKMKSAYLRNAPKRAQKKIEGKY